jgi:hypothetical protein
MDRSTERTSAALLTVTLVALLVGGLALVAATVPLAAINASPPNSNATNVTVRRTADVRFVLLSIVIYSRAHRNNSWCRVCTAF